MSHLKQAAAFSSLPQALPQFSLGCIPCWFEIPHLLKSQPSYKIIRLTLLPHYEIVSTAYGNLDKICVQIIHSRAVNPRIYRAEKLQQRSILPSTKKEDYDKLF